MADNIVRLKVDSTEYDSKVKRAADGILALERSIRKAGESFIQTWKDEQDFAKGLGDMETKSKTASGRISELRSALTEMSVVYKRMTDEEKASPFGQNLGLSLDKLKSRLKEEETTLADVRRELGDTGREAGGISGVLETLAGKFGLNVKQLTTFGGALAAAKTAVDVAKDAFFASEGNIDEWGRTVSGAKGAYDVFLQTLNGGNWGGFFDNLTTAINGARDLYDSLDRLGSIKANNQAAIAIVQQQIARLRLMKQQGKDVDEQLKQATAHLAELQGQAVTQGRIAGRDQVRETIRTGVNAYNKTGVEVRETQIRSATARVIQEGQGAFDYYRQQEAELRKKGSQNVTRYNERTGKYYEQEVFYMQNLTQEEQRRWLVAKAITERETKIQEGLGTYAAAVREGASNAREEFKGNRYALTGNGRGGSSSGGSVSTKTPQGKADDIVSKAEAEYAATLDKIAVRREAGLDTALQAKQKEVAATEKLYDAYTTAYNTYADPTYKDMASFTASMLGALAGKVNEAKDAQDAEKQAAQQLAEAEKKKAREMEQQKLMGTFSESGVSAGISYLKGKKAEAVIGSAEYKNFDAQLTDATTMGTLTGVMDKYNITPDQINVDAAGIWQKIINGNDIANADWQGVADAINEKLSEMGIEPVKLDVQTGGLKNVAKDVDVLTSTTKNAGSAMTQLGGALAGLEDPSAKVAGIVMQAIGNVALSFSQAMATPKDPWSWIAFAVAGTATMISTIAAIHSATGYAEGGLIKGNSYSGDNIMANGGAIGLNAGELVLNKAQQANIANQLNEPGSALQLGGTVKLRGSDMYIQLNNYGKETGRGRLRFSK